MGIKKTITDNYRQNFKYLRIPKTFDIDFSDESDPKIVYTVLAYKDIHARKNGAEGMTADRARVDFNKISLPDLNNISLLKLCYADLKHRAKYAGYENIFDSGQDSSDLHSDDPDYKGDVA